MSVLEQVRADAVRALKAGEKDVVGALRLLASELQKEARDGSGDELTVLRREHKRRMEAAAQFQAAHRPELADKELAEAVLIAQYMPPELSEAQLAAIVAEAVMETGAASPKDMGMVMKAVMGRTGGQVDGKRASAAVRAALAQ